MSPPTGAGAAAWVDASMRSAQPAPQSAPRTADPWAETRRRMVEYEMVAAGVKDPRVCDAMRATPRHEFVPASLRRYAYFDIGMPIGEGQTITSPFVVAYMTEQLHPQPTDKVLEIGTGSGYQAAVLSGLVAEVYSIEIVEKLGQRAAKTLSRLGYDNVKTKIGDGYQGWPEHAPFDKIIVTCSPEKVPKPLVEQLQGGRPPGGSPRAAVPANPVPVHEGQGSPPGRAFAADVLRADDGPSRARAGRAGRGGRARVGQRRLPGRPGRSAGRLVLRPPGQGRKQRPDVRWQVPHIPERRRRAARPGLASGRPRWPQAREVEISLWVRGERLQPGSLPGQHPGLVIVFFNTNREAIFREGIGPWSGTFDWVEKRLRMKVPTTARLASVEVGLWGATGQVSVGPIALKVVASKAPAGGKSE